MDNRLIISTIVICLWVGFVVYCLFNGSKIQVQTKPIKTVYWIITAFTVCLALFLMNGISIWCLILMGIMLLSTALYISIPSGYNSKGIYIRGLCFPYRKIEDMGIERVLKTCRLNFKCFYRIFYIDCDSYAVLKDCETLYKREKYHD